MRGRFRTKNETPTRVAPRVTAPKPLQTSSLKAESGCFDVGTVLVPARGGWGSAKPPVETTPRRQESPTTTTSDEDHSATDSQQSSSSQQQQGDLSASPPQSSSAAAKVAAPWTILRAQDKDIITSSKAYETDFPEPGRPSLTMIRPPETTAAASSSVEHPPPTHSETSALDEPTTTDVTPTHVFTTPSPDEADTAEERQRRLAARAAEQQQLILQQVQAARKSREKANDVAVAKKTKNKGPMILAKGAKVDQQPPLPVKSRKGPRTKGRLYSRRADGSLVEVGIDEQHEQKAEGQN